MTLEVQRPPAASAALAYSNAGSRFSPPANAAWWRVKRFGKSGRGAGEVVYAADGVPLFVPIDADHTALRAAVGDKPGKYKLDPVDEDHNEVESPSAYVVLGGDDVGTIDMRDEMIYRLVRTNKEITETVVEKFSAVMDAAAKVLNAADGAGLPQRRPPAPPVVQMVDAPRASESQSDGGSSGGMDRLAALAEQFSPLLGHLMCTKLIGLSDEETASLMSTAGASSAPTAPAVQRIESSERPALEVGEAPVQAPQAPVAAPAEQLARVMAQLTPKERQAAMSLARGLPPDDRQRWIATLMGMSAADAVAEVRNVLRRAELDAPAVPAPSASSPAVSAPVPSAPAPVTPTPAPVAAPAPVPAQSVAPPSTPAPSSPVAAAAAPPPSDKPAKKKPRKSRKRRKKRRR